MLRSISGSLDYSKLGRALDNTDARKRTQQDYAL